MRCWRSCRNGAETAVVCWASHVRIKRNNVLFEACSRLDIAYAQLSCFPFGGPLLKPSLVLIPAVAGLFSFAHVFAAGQAATSAPADIVLRNATVMTASHGTISPGSVWVHAGKIAAVGATVNAPASATIVDATGKFVTPGIIDPHSHSALDSDVNEATSPVTPSMMMIDAFDNRDTALYQALAGGVTTELLLHGSANMIGGQAVQQAADAERQQSGVGRLADPGEQAVFGGHVDHATAA